MGKALGAVSTLLISACPGPPSCAAVRTYLFVDGLDVVARSDSRMAGLDPRRLLRRDQAAEWFSGQWVS
jgi:hypothetical protein